MKYALTVLFFTALFFTSCTRQPQPVTFSTDALEMGLDGQGFLTHLLDRRNGRDLLTKDTVAPLLSVRLGGALLLPEGLQFEPEQNLLRLSFNSGLEVEVRVEEKGSHLVFELAALSDTADVELVLWGPYPLAMDEVIGETVGVVQDGDFSIGIQALNPKTLGGYPWQENDCMPQIDIFSQEDYSDLEEGGDKRYVLYRVEAAKPTSYGCSLQAYCRNRNRERVTENWGHDHYTVPPFDDGGVVGSRIALFGCPRDATLAAIAQVELAEGLPHPMIDGQWGKTAPSASAAYLILPFSEANIEEALAVTRRAGLRYLYHPGPFKNWGHFELDETAFPSGRDGLKRCAQTARDSGIFLGVHTLSNFITTDDPYVTPVPDPRLAAVGESVLASAISEEATEIPVASPVFFNQFANNNLKTVQVGEELIRYGGVNEQEPWKLTDCQRGAFGTAAAAHEQGAPIRKLADHAYKVFLTNPALGREMAERLAGLFNDCGLHQISFDGIEGNRSTGMGNYGEILFANWWYSALSEDVKSHLIIDASRTSHYFWHIYSRMNWGEPWYAGFRESQTEYRMANQAYFRRNLMPAMLGWFQLTESTSLQDVEWMLARSAGFDAGYGFVVNPETLKKNHLSEAILEKLGLWEAARMKGAFPEELKERLQDINNEFELEPAGAGEWRLQEVQVSHFRHEHRVRQPGEPLYSTFDFKSPKNEQPVAFLISAQGAGIENLRLELDNYKAIEITGRLNEGEVLWYKGGNNAEVYSVNWEKLREAPVGLEGFTLKEGPHQLLFDCTFLAPEEGAHVRLEWRLPGIAGFSLKR
ncbi:MAG: hypothetical protein H6560_25395 [Lewinellaceae bacterium]|nr:hypothetical protein [Lewinellaceae bacterium]